MNHACLFRRTAVGAAAAATALAMSVTPLAACTSPSRSVSTAQPATSAPVTTANPAPSGPASSTPGSPAPTPSSRASAPPTPAPPAHPAKLKVGSKGAAVAELQRQLLALGYWLSKPDGKFGNTTQQAVFALQKVAGQKRTGTVTAKTWATLDAGKRPTARSKSGHVIEVDLKRDIVMFVTGAHVDYILNTSTGGGYTYTSQGVTSRAITPKGHFKTYRVIDGLHKSPLGLMLRPRYFTAGYALHGDGYVPAYPVSHGCVRISDAAINWVWSTKIDPIGTPVWVY